MSTADVLVYGATAAGVAAAVAAREAGATTILVAPDRHVGGMVAGGLSWTDVCEARELGGFARRFHSDVADHYGAPLWSVPGPEPHWPSGCSRRCWRGRAWGCGSGRH